MYYSPKTFCCCRSMLRFSAGCKHVSLNTMPKLAFQCW